jgi:hypothetical protein
VKSLTFFFVLGGHISHYDNLARCLYSIKNKSRFENYKVVILEFGNKLKSNDKVRVINVPDEIEFGTGKKVGYKMWQQKYRAALEVDTDYGMYLDTDVVLYHDVFESLIDYVKDGIGVVPHFWVPTIGHFRQNGCPPENHPVFDKLITSMGLTHQDMFFAGGAFIFANNDLNRKRMQWVWDQHVDFYTGKEYTLGITDELFLAGAVKKFGKGALLPGSVNHCSMGEQYMPMKYENQLLYGCNPYEEKMYPITFLHCDVSSHSNCNRDPSLEYSGEMKKAVYEAFMLDRTFINEEEEYKELTNLII